MKSVSLVFSIFNKLEYTKIGLSNIYNCFNVKKNAQIPIYVVITDDGSTDGSSQWIAINHPEIHLLKGTGTLWWSGGINKAVRYAIEKLKSDYILLWNNDIKPETNYFDNLFALLETNDTHNIICSKIYMLGTNKVIFGMGGNFNPKTGKHGLYGYDEMDTGQFNQPINVDWFPGMGTCIHKSVFDKVGFFDEKVFPQYHGDADFALRTKKEGYTIISYPELVIWNDRSNTGFSNNANLGEFLKSFYVTKSNFNVYKNFVFYWRYTTSIFAYFFLIKRYFLHIAGFLKWKGLSIFGIYRKRIN